MQYSCRRSIAEAREKSGSLITADYALDQGKTVFALPGRVSDALSKGCNYLLYQGAQVAYEPGCILEELGIFAGKTDKKEKNFSKEEQEVYDHLEIWPKSLGKLVDETGLKMPVLSGILLSLQLQGTAVESYRNYWRKYGEF